MTSDAKINEIKKKSLTEVSDIGRGTHISHHESKQ